MTTSFLTLNYNGPQDKSYSEVLKLAYELSDLGVIFEYWNMEYGHVKRRWHLHAKVRSPYRFQYKQFNNDGRLYQTHVKPFIEAVHIDYIMADTFKELCTNINHFHSYMDIHDKPSNDNEPGGCGANECVPCNAFRLNTISTNRELLSMKEAAAAAKNVA